MPRRLAFPAPYRCSHETGSTQALRSKLVLAPKDRGLRHANHVLVLSEFLAEQKLYTTAPWTEADALRLISSGGWFDFSRTEFEDKATREFAMAAQVVQYEYLEA